MPSDDHQRSFLTSIASFLSDLLKEIVSSMFVVMLTFLLATFVSAGLLWFYDWPLVLAPVGGFVVIGVMLALWYDS
jgi:ABC-type bacteriocin/lantibiotic exporter with double-glycine peptidase domain